MGELLELAFMMKREGSIEKMYNISTIWIICFRKEILLGGRSCNGECCAYQVVPGPLH